MYSWFVRDSLDAVSRLEGPEALERFRQRLPDRLKPHANLDRLRGAPPDAVLPLEVAEELILALESILGDGSGQFLERVCHDLVQSALARGRVSLKLGDLLASVERLRPMVERPYVGVVPTFEVSGTDTGIEITVCVPRQPRSARIMRYWTLGAVRAAERFAQDARVSSYRSYAELVGDRAHVWIRYPRSSDAEVAFDQTAPKSRRPTPSPASLRPSLQLEVDRILRRSTPLPGPMLGAPPGKKPE